MIFGKKSVSLASGVETGIGKILFKATVKKYESGYSNDAIKNNVGILTESIRFIDRGSGLSSEDEIIIHNSYKDSTLFILSLQDHGLLI